MSENDAGHVSIFGPPGLGGEPCPRCDRTAEVWWVHDFTEDGELKKHLRCWCGHHFSVKVEEERCLSD